jgi:membrane protein DedA with SNARE-associated domain
MPEWIKGTIDSLGYLGITLLMIIENVFPPIPSELIMPLAGFLTTQGEFLLLGVVIAGTAGSVLGALLLYYVGKKVGTDRLKFWADSYGHWLMLSSDDIGRAQEWFHRHGTTAVFLCRLVPGIRSLISVPAGIERMRLPLFLTYSALGTGIWATILAYLGRVLGRNYEKVGVYLGPISYVVLGGFLVCYMVYVVKHRKHKGS